jgi:sulfhydrogenase subunit alpha
LAQLIHSHALHVFFLSFPDFIGISNDFDLVKKYPTEAVAALHFRDWALKLCDTIGGRVTHPINSVVGGFNVPPDHEELQRALSELEPVVDQALKVVDFVKRKARVPKFTNPTNFVTLKKAGEYAHLDGDLFLSDTHEKVKVKDFISSFTELSLPYEAVKRVEHSGQTYFVGALARVNNNFDNLNPVAKSIWEKLKVDRPCYNSFYNLQAQAVEIVHAFEEIQKLLAQYLKIKNPKLLVNFKVNPGRGASVIEAPRGILFHYYELNKDGIVTHSNIVTPTAQFLANLEADLKEFLPTLTKYDEAKQKQLIKTLIRAYDPCISCATH